MRHIALVPFTLAFLFTCTTTFALTIIRDGASDYAIVLPDEPIPAERTAADELAEHLEKMTRVRLPIVPASRFRGGHGIFLGNCPQLADLGVTPDWNQLGKEGYLFRVSGKHLVICGGRPRGTLYGVYWLLEKHLDCRWFTPDTTVVPRRATVELPDLNLTGAPAFEYRDPWMFIGWGQRVSRWWEKHFSQAYVARTRNSGRRLATTNMGDKQLIDNRHGGVFKIPYFGHNMRTMFPFDKYGETHPEYYALQEDGKRLVAGEQHVDLCLSNPQVALEASNIIRRWMREHPDADMFFVGQSDASHFCRCDGCTVLHKQYGGVRSGPNLDYVNAIAAKVEGDFPDSPIGTFAYQPTYQAPQGLKAHRNVVVWFCPITRCFCHPIHEGLINNGFYHYVDELTDWTRIASKVYVYDYNINCLDPPMDLLKLPETIRTYHRLGVRGIEIDSVQEIQIGFQFLRYWLMIQLFNDNDFNFEKGLGEFLEAYYGAAAGPIRDFIELSSDPRMYEPATAKRAAIWYTEGSPKWQELRQNCLLNWRMLSRAGIERSYELFEKARAAVADEPLALQHVLSARMTLQYAMLEKLPADDPRLEAEAEAFLKLGEELELRSVKDDKLEEYARKVID